MEDNDKIEEISVKLLGSSTGSGGGGGGEYKWVDGSEVDSESPPWSVLDEHEGKEGYGSLRRRLVKKPKRVDSFDVEAMSIAGAHKHHSKDVSTWQTLAIAFQTLGVVYGDMGTSPLYVFADVFSKVKIDSEVDVLGALSLVMYTIALLPLAKYVFVVLKANDNGEGGTFALYSLISRYAKVNLLPNRQTADEQISSFRLKLPTPELERALKIKENLERRSSLKTLLLLLVLMGTSMVIGDGILTPAISVMSAVSGLQGEIPGFGTNAVVIVSIVILAVLFSIQRFGTGAEAMFADLGHFSVRAIQIAFTSVVFPCLLAYMGQAAYLMKYRDSAHRIFYDSVPDTESCEQTDSLFWPVLVIATIAAMIASQAMISATFSCVKQSMALGCFPRLKIVHTSRKRMVHVVLIGIAEVGVMMVSTTLVTLVMLLIWQTNLFLALCFPLVFGSIELMYLSAVLSKVMEGGWLPLAFASIFLCVMYTWNYGSVLKYQRHSLNFRAVSSKPSSYSFYYSFVCIKYVPVPVVPQEERFLFRRVCPKDYHMFRCVARYGYKDVRKEDHHSFEQLLVDSLENFLRREALDLAMETNFNEPDIDSVSTRSRDSRIPVDDGNEDLRTPLVQDERFHEAETSTALPSSIMSVDEDPSLEYELSALREAMDSGFTYLLGHGDVRAKKNSLFIKKLFINYFYAFLRKNCRAGAANMSVPHMNIIQVGMTYMV
ncbi:hypothetical protein FNV43_RR26470 [Rhamnella rubrinervis]|uniref:Potassium transporter n=1 Tax=Rhamnella rubrinervis TaxID=2594499 RepID=A0A8K0DPD1_9ROSA|nr:hypothetical protein FNV43_RR26470 [Rhamnella rubrinervis]